MCRRGSTRLAVVTDKVVVYIMDIAEEVVCVDEEVEESLCTMY